MASKELVVYVPAWRWRDRDPAKAVMNDRIYELRVKKYVDGFIAAFEKAAPGMNAAFYNLNRAMKKLVTTMESINVKG